jgi:hypothetical protein
LWAEDETIGWIYQYFNSKEERNKMRKESDAPRNSRELAVRNQFFTPRYVVEFLTDNTLGRMWYEMTQGETSLKESCQYLVRRPSEIFLESGVAVPEASEVAGDLSQEALLGQPVYIPFRQLKDPRSMRMIDPACGSMHFGLYAFDLYERIYEEAWDLERLLGASRFQRDDGLKPLAESYASQEAFLQDVPRLIIEHNIHGIDIDPRAVQIAGLSLWLRAQRSWQGQGLKAKQRPQIQKSNVICAEPMPGEVALLSEFLECHLSDTPEQRLVGQLVLRVFEAMKLAGEAGSLLKIEQEISQDIEEAKQQWLNRPEGDQLLLLTVETNAPQQQELSLQVGDITDERFWERVEDEIYQALNRYAEQVEGGNSYQRRLFANDAARGFAFIDICRKKFDVALMNPPFGLSQTNVNHLYKKQYPNTYVDLYACFATRGCELTPQGMLGVISSRSFITAKKLVRWRTQEVINTIQILLDLGLGVMDDAYVESAAYILEPCSLSKSFDAYNCRSDTDKEMAVRKINQDNSQRRFSIRRSELLSLPSSKILYSVPTQIYNLLRDPVKFEPTIGTVREGMRTFVDVRFLRLRWEVSPETISPASFWEPLAKGGEFSRFYSDIHLVVKWNLYGDELAEENKRVNGQIAQSRQASDYYRLSGATYSKRSVKGFSVRALPAGCIIGTKGPAVLNLSDIAPAYLVGWLNSRLMVFLVRIQANFNEYNTGILKQLPWRYPSNSGELTSRTYQTIVLGREMARISEVNSFFSTPVIRNSLHESFVELTKLNLNTLKAVENCQEMWDEAIDEIYGIDSSGLFVEDEVDIEEEDNDDSDDIGSLTLIEVAKSIFSYMIGCAFGRWDTRLSGNNLVLSTLPSPFEQLPACPPGMLINSSGFPATSGTIVSEEWLYARKYLNQLPLNTNNCNPAIADSEYPIPINWDGILVDEEGHSSDIVSYIHDVLKTIWSEKDGDIEQEFCQILKIDNLRDYIRKPAAFFADHLSRYSKSRRQAPIYLPLSTSSGSYTLWLYYHRLTDQTLYTCINDYIEPKLLRTRDLAAQLGNKPDRTTSDSKQLETLQDLESELADLRDELLRIAKLPYQPNLNDGVQITVAPLWSLFRLPKWQKKLKETWETLEKGDYDWAHLAYSIWPDRIRQKCQTDKSLAIAHNLETLYEPPPEKPKKPSKTKRKTSIQPDLTP